MVELLKTSMEMVKDNMGYVGNNVEEAWGNSVEDHYFMGDNIPSLQGIISATILLISLPNGLQGHQCLAEQSEMPIATLETRSRISSFQSHALR